MNVDTTRPEAYQQFDVATHAIATVARDELSGAAVPTVRACSAELHDREEETSHSGDGRLRTCSFTMSDNAGNIVVVLGYISDNYHHKEDVTSHGDARTRIAALRYNSGETMIVPANQLKVEWRAARRGVHSLEQAITLGAGRERQKVEAHFDARMNRTLIRTESLRAAGDEHASKTIIKQEWCFSALRPAIAASEALALRRDRQSADRLYKEAMRRDSLRNNDAGAELFTLIPPLVRAGQLDRGFEILHLVGASYDALMLSPELQSPRDERDSRAPRRRRAKRFRGSSSRSIRPARAASSPRTSSNRSPTCCALCTWTADRSPSPRCRP